MIHRLEVRVYYEDTDFTGVVYHANYLRFAERGRSEYLRALGMYHNMLLHRKPPIAFVIQKMEINFLKAAHIDELLVVETRLQSAHGVKFTMAQEIKREQEMIWRADVIVAMINVETKKPTRASDLMAILTKNLAQTGG